ncbi:MAG: cation-transporting P-type ATPase [Candidatus Binatia bacterium]|nr:cation-transporting P-type ATPase [Candidatus Binatia bacterium]
MSRAPAVSHPTNLEVHTVPVSAVYEALHSRPQGLTQAEARVRLQRYGRNTIQRIATGSLSRKFLSHFTHMMALLLWLGGLIGFLAQLPQLGVAIWLVNCLNGIFSFWQEYKAEQAITALRRVLPTYARVLRDGQEQRIVAEELVPGDVLLLAAGDLISADARVVQETELRVDQSTLTGESHPVRKTAEAMLGSDAMRRAELPNLVFAGTSVAAGTGTAVVFATGMNSEFGKLAHLTQSVTADLSPLQREMQRTTKVITVIAVAVGSLFFVLALALTQVTVAESLLFALGMIVAFVPEGLLPTVTLALAMGTQRMARRHALIKRLSAVETLGCTTVICTDKTGTLTQNALTVRELWVAGRRLTVTGVGYAPEGDIREGERRVTAANDSDLRHLLVAAGLCTDARVLPPTQESRQWTVLGDPTEAALRVVASKGGIDLEAEARRMPRVRELPFDSRRKRMTTLHQGAALPPRSPGVTSSLLAPDHQQPTVAFVKGAPKELLALCTHILRQGQVCPLDEGERAQILAANDQYARNGLRVLAVGQRVLPHGLTHVADDAIECDLTFLGLVAMLDPPRPEVAAAVAKCHRAGIRIIMITGDYGLTAESIARRIGIIRAPRPRLVTGADLNTMDEAALRALLQAVWHRGEEVIFARVAPEHKLRIVTALQGIGQVVAVTGDGVNDAPALRQADIGIAMGLSGTDVAKEAADMILTDDNFASIVNAIEEGRAVYANIKKFISYIFTSNTPEAVPFILFAFSGGRIPLALNIMQILSIDLGTDIVPALALGAEPPEPGVMDRPPRDLQAHLITRSLLVRAYFWLGILQSLAAMTAFYFLYWTNGYWGQWLDLPASGPLYRAATAMTLAAVVVTQIGNLFAQRTEHMSVVRIDLWNNWLLWGGIATELTLVFLIIYVPFLQEIFGTAAFPLRNWVFLLAWAPSLLVADELRKACVRRRGADIHPSGERERTSARGAA